MERNSRYRLSGEQQIMNHKDDTRKSLEAYAWPGGYPVMYLAQDGWRDEETGILELNPHDRSENVCCAQCAADKDSWPDLIIVASYVHYEGEPEYCEYCDGFTESAYGNPDDDN
jgi:hypothetical protein